MTTQQAARNNAEWCDLMCRAHGRPGVFGERAWTNAHRTPVLYPDAVTLSPEARAEDVLPYIDLGPDASVKDSFATLDLTGAGFRVLFEAQWIHREPRPAPTDLRARTGTPLEWEVARDVREWERACFPMWPEGGLFLPSVLDEAVLLCARIDGEIACGSVLNASEEVVGVSNVFASACDIDAAWAGTLALAADLFPGQALVGYEGADELAAPLAFGFTTTGPLRVWIR
ncbi:hypothetical protein [Nonomuraea sp. NPDC050310]|uniref:hypothetical protein n=1 Tax=Nonomuraea sp. NPDC050310 TaxID=3154935 RepID=UPI00340F6D30